MWKEGVEHLAITWRHLVFEIFDRPAEDNGIWRLAEENGTGRGERSVDAFVVDTTYNLKTYTSCGGTPIIAFAGFRELGIGRIIGQHIVKSPIDVKRLLIKARIF